MSPIERAAEPRHQDGSVGDDHLPEAAFYMVAGIDEAVAKAQKMASEA